LNFADARFLENLSENRILDWNIFRDDRYRKLGSF